jgi:hypothetical protein
LPTAELLTPLEKPKGNTVSNNSKGEKEDLNDAFSGINDGLSGIFYECMVVGRYIWNMEMRMLRSVGVMHFFVSRWWLFVVLGFLLLAFVMPIGVAFLFTAYAAGQMAPKGQDEFIVPLRRVAMDHGNVEEKTPEKPDALREYGKKMGAFKDVTLEWVISNKGPLLELPDDISVSLSVYLIEASAEACKCAGIEDDLHQSMHLVLLGKMGFPPEVASGMVAAAASNLFADGQPTAGEVGYKEWDQQGEDAALTNIAKAYTAWVRAKGLSDEIGQTLS